MIDSALFLIDLQVGNLNHLNNAESIVNANKEVLVFARSISIPVFHFKYHEEQRDKRFGKAWTSEGTPEGEFHPELKPIDTENVFTKLAYGAFSVLELDNKLKSQGIKTVWLTGVMSQVCVLATAYEAYALKYQVNVITDAVGATSQENLDLGLEWMRKYVADLKSIEEFHDCLK